MSASVAVALPASLRRRSEIIGVAAGALCFLVAFFGASLAAFLPAGASGVALPMVLLSFVAGAAGCFIAYSFSAYAAPRLGIRAGLIAAISSGAGTVVAATLHAFGIGSFPDSSGTVMGISSLLPAAGAYLNLVVALLGVPPAIFFGLAGSLITAMLLARSASPKREDSTTQPRPLFRDPVFSAVIALSIVGYLSPLVIPLKPKPRLKPVVAAAAPSEMQTAVTAPPPPPKWRYQKPAEFDSADAGQIIISNVRNFEIDGDLPLALSRNEARLAYFRQGQSTTLEVRELDTLDLMHSITLGGTPSAIAWSPDESKILVISQAESKVIQICDLSTGAVTTLPQPINGRIPAGLPGWWSEDEVVFFQDDASNCLSLDTLRVSSASENGRWNALPKEKRSTIATYLLRSPLPANSKWAFEPQLRIRSYDTGKDPNAPWTANQWVELALSDRSNAFRSTLAQLEINGDDQVLATSDGTKFLQVRGRKAALFYLGVRPKSGGSLNVPMALAPDSSFNEAVAEKTLCAFICSPTINPLNGKTVGPDRQQVKALVRLAKWKDNQAELWITEAYLPVRSGDVIADLHVWNDHRPRAIATTGAKEWFALVDQLDAKAPPAKSEVAMLDRQVAVDIASVNGGGKVARVIKASIPRPPPKRSQAPPSVAVTREPTEQTQPDPPPPIASRPPRAENSAIPQNVTDLLTTFIYQHHAKSSRNDVAGLVGDYGDRVDHFDHGIVDREYIRKDETEYHSPGTRITETVTTRPSFSAITAGVIAADYVISFQRVQADGRWAKGTSEIQLQINLTPQGPRITSQKSQTSNLQKGR